MKTIFLTFALILPCLSYAKILGKIENKKTNEKITLECNEQLCDHMYINYFDENGKGEELKYISFAMDQELTDLQGGATRKGYSYNLTTPVLNFAGDAVMLGPRSGVNTQEALYAQPGEGGEVIGGILAFVVTAPIGVAAGGAGLASGMVIGIGETLYYVGRGAARGVIDTFDRDARGLRKYRKVISGSALKMSDKMFNDVRALILN